MNNPCTILLCAIKSAADIDNALTDVRSVINNDVQPHITIPRDFFGMPSGKPTIEGPDPVQSGLGGALAGAGIGAALGGGLQLFRREVSREPEKDKPSIMRGLLGGAAGGALLGGGASYIQAGDSYRNYGLGNITSEMFGKTAPGLDMLPGVKEQRSRLLEGMANTRPGFFKALPVTMNPTSSPAARLLQLMKMNVDNAAKGGVFDEILQK